MKPNKFHIAIKEVRGDGPYDNLLIIHNPKRRVTTFIFSFLLFETKPKFTQAKNQKF